MRFLDPDLIGTRNDTGETGSSNVPVTGLTGTFLLLENKNKVLFLSQMREAEERFLS